MKARLIPETGPHPKVKIHEIPSERLSSLHSSAFYNCTAKTGTFFCEGRRDFCRDLKFFQDSEKNMGHLSFLSDILAFIFHPNKFLQDLSHQTLV